MFLSRLASAALPLILAVSAASAQPATQVITVWSFGFAPHPIHLAAGRPVTLSRRA